MVRALVVLLVCLAGCASEQKTGPRKPGPASKPARAKQPQDDWATTALTVKEGEDALTFEVSHPKGWVVKQPDPKDPRWLVGPPEGRTAVLVQPIHHTDAGDEQLLNKPGGLHEFCVKWANEVGKQAPTHLTDGELKTGVETCTFELVAQGKAMKVMASTRRLGAFNLLVNLIGPTPEHAALAADAQKIMERVRAKE